MAIKKSCYDCSGNMEKPVPVHSYDFNKDGWVPLVCNDCGLCSDSERSITPHIVSSILGHRFIERVMEDVCNTKMAKNYDVKKEILKLLKIPVFSHPLELAEEITTHCQTRGYCIIEDSILKIIYNELDYSAFS